MSNTITLTPDEARAVDSLLLYTGGDFYIEENPDTAEGVEAVIRRLQLEAAIREGTGWWDRAARPFALAHDGTCPDSFTLTGKAARALVAFLPLAYGDVLDSTRATVHGLAARLNVELAEAVTA